MAATIYKQAAKVNLPSDNLELENFFWQVTDVYYDVVKDKTKVIVRHWFGAKAKRDNGAREETYPVNNIVGLGQIEAKALTLPQYLNSIAQ
jgi:hypothetical protein